MRSIKIIPILFILCFVHFSCIEKQQDEYIITVGGPVLSSEMGHCLSHEHVLVDWIGAAESGPHRWDRDSVIEKVMPYLVEIRELGVKTFIDCSPAYLGRDPILLQELSRRTGLNILTSTGYYGAVDNRFIPGFAWDETAEDLARRWIGEYRNGIDGSGIKPGFIKIGVKEDSPLSEFHAKLVRAAAITHRETGLVIKSHTGGDIPAFEQIYMLIGENISPGAFIWTHAQNGSLDAQVRAARLGAWISFDGVNISSSGEDEPDGNLDWYTDRLSDFKKAGLLDKVLISHDAGWYDAGEPGGGGFRGYSDIHRHLLPALRDSGFTPEEIELLISVNPAKAFAVRVRTE
jgi:phosphotriesterase-related protein